MTSRQGIRCDPGQIILGIIREFLRSTCDKNIVITKRVLQASNLLSARPVCRASWPLLSLVEWLQ